MIYRIIIFLALNFGALAIGGIFTNSGVESAWYISLAKAPWTPPGWVFGAAWTTIMILFGLYMAKAWAVVDNRKTLIVLYAVQWLLNVSWNPVFFYYQQVLLGLIVIGLLTLVVGLILFIYRRKMGLSSLLLLPYLVWLFIATSLNAYIFLEN